MTIKIEIEVPTDLVLKGIGSEYLDMAAGALGFARGVSSVSQTAISTAQGEPMTSDEMARRDLLLADAQARAEGKNLDGSDRRETVEEPKAEAPKRERGKPSQGRARRTKEEIAADEAAETEKTGLASIDVLRRLVGDYQKKHGMPAAVKLCQEGGLIGKPIHELDDVGIEAAIAAMQSGKAPAKAEEPAPVEEPVELAPKTKADLVEAMMRYADKYDGTRDQAKMVHTLADMPKVFVATFGEGVDKLSKVPEDRYAEAVAAVEAAIEADPYGRAK